MARVDANGRLTPAVELLGGSTWSLEGLALGDVVLRQTARPLSPDPTALGDAWTVPLHRSAPATLRLFVVDLVPGAAAAIEAVAGDAADEAQRTGWARLDRDDAGADPVLAGLFEGLPGAGRRVAYVARNIDAWPTEPAVAEDRFAEPHLHVTFDGGVGFAERRARAGERFHRLEAPSPELRRIAERIAPRGSVTERMRDLVAFVASEVRPDRVPDEPLRVLWEQRGDALALVYALAFHGGLPVEPVGIAPPGPLALGVNAVGPADEPELEGIGLRWRDAGQTHIALVDERHATVDRLPPHFAGARLFSLSRPWAAAEPLPASARDPAPLEVRLQLAPADAAGDRFEGAMEVRFSASRSAVTERQLREAAPDALAALVARWVASVWPGGTVVGDPRMGRDDEDEARLRWVIPVAWRASDERVSVLGAFEGPASTALGHFPDLQRLFDGGPRYRAARIPGGAERVVLELRLPARAALVGLPADVSFEVDGASLARRARKLGDWVRVEREIRVDEVRVSPTAFAARTEGLSRLFREASFDLEWVLPAPSAAVSTAARRARHAAFDVWCSRNPTDRGDPDAHRRVDLRGRLPRDERRCP